MSAQTPLSLGYRVPYEAMDFVWVNDFYDYPLSGLCRFVGQLCRFELIGEEYVTGCEDEPELTYGVFPLHGREKLRWLIRKAAFEICVGTHWTYPHRRRRFRWRKPKWPHKLLFEAYYRLTRR